MFFLITISSFAQQATEESNAILSKQIEGNNKRLEILRTEDSLQKILIEQSGDIDKAISDSPGLDAFNDEYGKLASPISDPYTIIKGADSSDVNRSDISKLIDSIPPAIAYIFWGVLAVLTIKFLFEKKE